MKFAILALLGAVSGVRLADEWSSPQSELAELEENETTDLA